MSESVDQEKLDQLEIKLTELSGQLRECHREVCITRGFVEFLISDMRSKLNGDPYEINWLEGRLKDIRQAVDKKMQQNQSKEPT
jgi:hypothetical protein